MSRSNPLSRRTLAEIGASAVPLSLADVYTALQTGTIDTFANSSSDQVLEFVIDNGTEYTDFELRTGISRDTRNRTFFASRGSLHALTVDARIPSMRPASSDE